MSARVLVAPDDFKGTFTAPQVTEAIARGLRDGGLEAIELPVADGGNGTMTAVVTALDGEVRRVPVTDPLGRPIEAEFGLLPDRVTAVVEMAQASGLALLSQDELDPWGASTRGTGELMVAAAEAGARKIIVAVGGSATTDGGRGAVEAIQAAGVELEIDVACDVRVKYEDAPRVFGPQKGADEEMIGRLGERLDEWAEAAPRDPRGREMTGAAGGLSGGLWAYLGAELVAGAPYVLDTVHFDERLRECSFVITGEGKLDEQTLTGKAVFEVATRCRQGGVACHAVVGTRALDDFQLRTIDLASVREATTLEELEAAGRALGDSAS